MKRLPAGAPSGIEKYQATEKLSEMTERTTRSPIHAIPDDPELSAYRFIIVAAKRARQIQGGQRSLLPSTSKKPTVAAMEEVRRGLVSYYDPIAQEPEAGAEETL